jgi:hypothetical protein
MHRVPPTASDRAEPLPLATAAAVRLFAWPDYADADELEHLFRAFAGELVGRTDVALCLRHDAWVDGPLERAVAALRGACERTLGPDAALELLLVDDELAPDDWTRLARAVQAAIVLPSSRRAPRSVGLATLFLADVTRIAVLQDLTDALGTHGATRFPTDALLPRARGGLGSPLR